jgi:phosphoglycolate phosphatase
MNFKYIFFDLDGTLTESGPGIINSVKYSLDKLGEKQIEDEVLTKFIGPSLMESYTSFCGFSGEKAERAIKYYREYFTDRGIFENSPYPGIAKLLMELNKIGKIPVMATSKPEPFAIQIAERYKIEKYFHRICGSNIDERSMTKADVIREAIKTEGIKDKSQIIMVGDRHYDVAGAHECDIKCVGVLYGYGTREELTAAGADYITETVQSLSDLLLNID